VLTFVVPSDQIKLYKPPPEVMLATICPLLLQEGCVKTKAIVGSEFSVTVWLRLSGQLNRTCPFRMVRV